jgi:negative regulator of sigma E activity
METKDMSCEECRTRVFELIEREEVDPDGVRAVLERCPDCRADFDAMKAALAAVEGLPIEEPPAEIDRAILRAAAERGQPKLIPLRRRFLQAPPWAMAAIALLAVGVGVWSIPGTVEFEGDADTAAPQAKEMAKLEEAPTDTAAFESEAAPAEAVAPEKSAKPVAARKASGTQRKRVASPKAAPVEADSAELEEAAPPAAARRRMVAEPQPASQGLARDEASERADSYGVAQPEGAVGGAAAAEVAAVTDDLDPKAKDQTACKSKVAAFEARLRKEKRFEPTAEQKLSIGRCYQTLGDTTKARAWLERAAKHRSTKKRANEALQRLGPK